MNTMHDVPAEPLRVLQVFEPDPGTMYTIEAAAQISQVPRRLIAVYCKLKMISPVANSAVGAFYFNDEGIHVLRQIEYLRSGRGINLEGIRMIRLEGRGGTPPNRIELAPPLICKQKESTFAM